MSRLQWGIIGTGEIARTFVEAIPSCRTARIVSVGSRAQRSADAFVAAQTPGQNVRAHGSYDALLADPDVQAVYVSTPHPQHEEWAIKAAKARKHVLCEKPIGLNARQAAAMIDAARDNGVFLMEAFMYRCHPQTARIVELIRSNAIGQVRLIQAAFGFCAPFNPDSRLFCNALAGGGILDVGCYPVSFSRLIAGVALGRDFADPIEVKGAAHLGQTGIDEYATAVLRFEGDILATVASAVRLEQDNTARIFGTEGHIFVPKPWVPAREGGTAEIILHHKGESPQTIAIEAERHLYAYEIDMVADGVERFRTAAKGDPMRGQATSPAMTWDDTLGNIRTLDAWRASIGLLYDAERA